MRRLRERIVSRIKNMKYRHKLTILLVVTSLVPMTVLALYSHGRMGNLIRENEMEDMYSILEQTREGIDSQIEVFSSLLNYLTYSPDIEELIGEKDMDRYLAYQMYTEVADPLLSVPKSYHDAILQIQLFAESIQVRHDYTLVPLSQITGEWWFDSLSEENRIQWLVDPDRQSIAAVRRIYRGKEMEAALCVTLDYQKIFQSFENIITEDCGGMILDEKGEILYRMEQIWDRKLAEAEDGEEVLSVLKDYAVVNSSSALSGWTFYHYKTKSAIDGSVSRLLLSEIPLILVCAGIILVIGLPFSRLFTRKIEELTENMNQVNQGRRIVTVDSDSEDEVGLLIRSFKGMMEEIDRLIREVYENKIALKEFELKALTAQINPHFLYNSLSIINWMAIRSDQMEISKVTLALSTFYRTALSKGQDMVTVENCIRNIEAYLEIQLVMHDHDFQVIWDIDPEISNEMLPKLILQPVVENALEHGLDVKEEGEKLLKLFFVQDGDDVLLAVEDNGMGMEQEEAESLVTYQAVGYGLKNVNDRICLLYGEQYRIRIFSKVGEGTRVEMRIPKGDVNIEA
ncbi:MAG: sensor histidine kinase [Eubacteriales bacterium]|nr:sensor histidine kinase [Eubacteriales bacterium]